MNAKAKTRFGHFVLPKGFTEKVIGNGQPLDDLFLELFFFVNMMSLAENQPEIKTALAQKVKRIANQIKHRKGKMKYWLAAFFSCFKTCSLCSNAVHGTCSRKNEAFKTPLEAEGCPFFSLSKSAVGRIVVTN